VVTAAITIQKNQTKKPKLGPYLNENLTGLTPALTGHSVEVQIKGGMPHGT
jgi:hypothetical protein